MTDVVATNVSDTSVDSANACIKLCDAADAIGDWLYDWQTLLAGVLALVGAYFTIRRIREQIAQAEVHRAEDIERRHNAARVALPLALSSVSKFVDEIAHNLANELGNYGPSTGNMTIEAILQKGGDCDGLPEARLEDNVIKAFQGFVETLTDANDIRHVAELLSSIQILESRYSSIDFEGVAVEQQLYQRFLDAAKVGLLNDKLFNYGRFLDSGSFGIVGVVETDDAWELIRSKAHSLVFARKVPDFYFQGLGDPIDSAKKHNLSPWLEKMD